MSTTIRMTGARIIAASLLRHGIATVTGIPGGANLPLFDAIAETPVRIVLARHEQGAGFISQGMARVSGRPQVCLATSGPGALNLVTGLADAKMDSIPVIAITGQVPTHGETLTTMAVHTAISARIRNMPAGLRQLGWGSAGGWLTNGLRKR